MKPLVFILSLWLAIIPAWADGVAIPGVPHAGQIGAEFSYPPTGSGNQTALDGWAQGASQSTGTTCTATLTTTQSQDLIVISAEANGPTAISSVTDTAGLTWTIGAISGGGTSIIGEATAPAPSALTGDTITVTFNATVSFCVITAFGISGYNTSSPFDGAAVTGAGDPVSITTANANDFIYGLFRVVASGIAAGSCCTLINNGTFQLNEYVKTTSTQSGLSINIGTPGDANGAIVHAVKSR